MVDTCGPVGLPGRMFMLMVMVRIREQTPTSGLFESRSTARRHQLIHEPARIPPSKVFKVIGQFPLFDDSS